MSDGTKSNLEQNTEGFTDVKIHPEGAVVNKIKVFGQKSSEIDGFIFFDKNGVIILKAGKTEITEVIKEIQLEQGERLVGIKSKIGSKSRQLDTVFVIGRIE